jgi:hypothetical protein
LVHWFLLFFFSHGAIAIGSFCSSHMGLLLLVPFVLLLTWNATLESGEVYYLGLGLGVIMVIDRIECDGKSWWMVNSECTQNGMGSLNNCGLNMKLDCESCIISLVVWNISIKRVKRYHDSLGEIMEQEFLMHGNDLTSLVYLHCRCL